MPSGSLTFIVPLYSPRFFTVHRRGPVSQNVSDRTRIDAFFSRESKRLGYCDVNMRPVAAVFDTARGRRTLQSHHLKTFPLAALLLPNASSYHYNLCNRRDQLAKSQLTSVTNSLSLEHCSKTVISLSACSHFTNFYLCLRQQLHSVNILSSFYE